MKKEVKVNVKVSNEELVTAIKKVEADLKKISLSFKAIANGTGLSKRVLVVLLSDHTGLNRGDVEKFLDKMVTFEKYVSKT